MKKRFIIIVALIPQIFGFSQHINFSPIFSTSSADFYKNAFGLSIDYSKRLNKNLINFGLHGLMKKNNYSEIAPDNSDSEGYIIRGVKGKLNIIGIDLGISKIFTENDCYSISLVP